MTYFFAFSSTSDNSKNFSKYFFAFFLIASIAHPHANNVASIEQATATISFSFSTWHSSISIMMSLRPSRLTKAVIKVSRSALKLKATFRSLVKHALASSLLLSMFPCLWHLLNSFVTASSSFYASTASSKRFRQIRLLVVRFPSK